MSDDRLPWKDRNARRPHEVRTFVRIIGPVRVHVLQPTRPCCVACGGPAVVVFDCDGGARCEWGASWEHVEPCRIAAEDEQLAVEIDAVRALGRGP